VCRSSWSRYAREYLVCYSLIEANELRTCFTGGSVRQALARHSIKLSTPLTGNKAQEEHYRAGCDGIPLQQLDVP
jgi:hypothetical protein